MKIERNTIGTVDVITPFGPLVDQDSENFSKLLTDRVKKSNSRVVLAMGEVPYLDSRAIEGLLDASDALANRANNLKLASVTPLCREVLELTGVSERFAYFEDVQAAVRSFL